MAAPKKGLGLLLIGSPKPKGDVESAKDEAAESPGKLAAQGLIDAVKDGDADAVLDAFKTLMDASKSLPDDAA